MSVHDGGQAYLDDGAAVGSPVLIVAVRQEDLPPSPIHRFSSQDVYTKASQSRGLVSDLGVPEQVDALFLEVLVARVLDRVPIALEEVDQSGIPRPRTLPEDLLVTIRALHIENTFTESEACQDEVKEFFQGLTWLKGLLSDDLGACDQP